MRLTALLLIVCVCGCGRKTPNSLLNATYDSESMDAAIEKARSEVDLFIKELDEKQGENHAVKVSVTDDETTEHLWMTDVEYADGKFTGVINNSPASVSNVSAGQNWTVDKSEITDWMFIYNFRIYGNFTVRPLLDEMPVAEAEKMRTLLGE